MNVQMGVTVFVRSSGGVLMGRKAVETMSGRLGEWTCPGGRMEYGESFEETAIREVREETGVEIGNARVADALFVWRLSGLCVAMTADYVGGVCADSDELRAVRWVDSMEVPRPLCLREQEMFVERLGLMK